jgi:hypothetical protein
MAFFVWHRTRLPRLPARRQKDRACRLPGPAPLFAVCVEGLTKTQAEDLLDWLEATGHKHRKLTYSEGDDFSVFYS